MVRKKSLSFFPFFLFLSAASASRALDKNVSKVCHPSSFFLFFRYFDRSFRFRNTHAFRFFSFPEWIPSQPFWRSLSNVFTFSRVLDAGVFKMACRHQSMLAMVSRLIFWQFARLRPVVRQVLPLHKVSLWRFRASFS